MNMHVSRLYNPNTGMVAGFGMYGKRGDVHSRLVLARQDAQGWYVQHNMDVIVRATSQRDAYAKAYSIMRLSIHEREVDSMLAFFGPVLNA